MSTLASVSPIPLVPAVSWIARLLNRTRKALVAIGYGFLSAGLIIGLWALVNLITHALPDPIATLSTLWGMLADPFYNNGPSDKGIGYSILISIWTVSQGFVLGSLISIPCGILMGLSPVFRRIINPVAQMLRPVSPLAWFPIALIVGKSAAIAGVFVIFITSLWPTLINTGFGVSSLPQDYRTLAKVYRFSRWRYLVKVVLPWALPYILTGLRMSLSTAWMVIVAAEMLAGGVGIGFFVFDSWNASNMERIISAILIIGVIGLLMDRVMEYFVKKTSHGV